jgi:hypothetical protein
MLHQTAGMSALYLAVCPLLKLQMLKQVQSYSPSLAKEGLARASYKKLFSFVLKERGFSGFYSWSAVGLSWFFAHGLQYIGFGELQKRGVIPICEGKENCQKKLTEFFWKSWLYRMSTHLIIHPLNVMVINLFADIDQPDSYGSVKDLITNFGIKSLYKGFLIYGCLITVKSLISVYKFKEGLLKEELTEEEQERKLILDFGEICLTYPLAWFGIKASFLNQTVDVEGVDTGMAIFGGLGLRIAPWFTRMKWYFATSERFKPMRQKVRNLFKYSN